MKKFNRFLLNKLTAHNVHLRLIALSTLFIGMLAAWNWQSFDNSGEKSLAVQIVPVFSENLPTETEMQERNPADYEAGGRFSNCPGKISSELAECTANFDRARNFILQNWQNKQRAYIVYEFTGADMSCDVYFFIEPDEKGEWRIVERWQTSYLSFDGTVVSKIYENITYQIRMHPVPKKSDKSYIGKFYLSFSDRAGNKIKTL